MGLGIMYVKTSYVIMYVTTMILCKLTVDIVLLANGRQASSFKFLVMNTQIHARTLSHTWWAVKHATLFWTITALCVRGRLHYCATCNVNDHSFAALRQISSLSLNAWA